MTRNHTTVPLLVVAALLSTACQDAPSEPSPEPIDESMLPFMFAPSAAMAGADSGTHPCPAGGSTSRDIAVEHSTSGDTVTVVYFITLEHRGCAIPIRDMTLTMDGELHIEGRDRRRFVNRSTQVIESRSRQTGRMRWRHDGDDRTCDIDVTQTLLVATGERQLEGSICGHPISVILPRFERP